MHIYFVSIRTALIYGPGELLEARSSGEDQMYMRLTWPNDYPFDEWEGYAVVVPEREQVWGLSHPAQAVDGELEFNYPFTPQPIPPGDRKLFPAKAASKPVTTSQDEEVWSFYQADADPEPTDYEDPYRQQDTFRREDS